MPKTPLNMAATGAITAFCGGGRNSLMATPTSRTPLMTVFVSSLSNFSTAEEMLVTAFPTFSNPSAVFRDPRYLQVVEI